MRRLWLALFILFLLFVVISEGRLLQAAWLRNAAALTLERSWPTQGSPNLNPTCHPVGAFHEAKRDLELSLVIVPNNTRALTNLGRIAWLRGDCSDAIGLWRQASGQGDSAAVFELFRLGEYSTVSPDLRISLAKMAYQHAGELAQHQNGTAAYPWYQRAFELAPRVNSALALADLNTKVGDASKNMTLWQRITNTLPALDSEYWWATAEIYVLNDEPKLAAIAFERGASMTSDPYTYWMRAGQAWQNDQNWEQATAAYTRAHTTQPDQIWPYMSLGTLNRRQNRLQDALAWFIMARDLDLQKPDPYYYIGETQYLMGNLAVARQNLEQSLNIYPDYPGSKYNLALIYYREGNHGMADAWLVAAIENTPGYKVLAQRWMTLGDWRLEWRNCTGAREAFTHVQAITPNDPIINQRMQTLTRICGS